MAFIFYLNVHGAVERLAIRHNIDVHKIEVHIFEVAVWVLIVLLQALIAAARSDDSEALRRRAVHCLVLVSDLQHVTVALIIVTVRVLGKDLAANSV